MRSQPWVLLAAHCVLRLCKAGGGPGGGGRAGFDQRGFVSPFASSKIMSYELSSGTDIPSESERALCVPDVIPSVAEDCLVLSTQESTPTGLGAEVFLLSIK